MEVDGEPGQHDEDSQEEDEVEAPPSGQGPPSDMMEAEQTADLSTASEAEEIEEEEEVRPMLKIVDHDVVLETPEPEETMPNETHIGQESAVNGHHEKSDNFRPAETALGDAEIPSSAGVPFVASKDTIKPRRASILLPPKTPASPRRSVVEVVIPVKRTPASTLTKPGKGVTLPKQTGLIAPPKTPKRPGDESMSPSLPTKSIVEGGSAITRQPSLLSLAVSPEDYLSAVGKPAAKKARETLPSAPPSPSRQMVEDPQQISRIAAPTVPAEQEAAVQATNQPPSRVSSFFRSLQEASSSESESSSEEDDDGYLEEETVSHVKRSSKSAQSARRSSSPEGPSEDEVEPSMSSRSSSVAISDHATDSSRILIPVEPPVASSIQTSPEPQQANETVSEPLLPSASPQEPLAVDKEGDAETEDTPENVEDQEANDSASTESKSEGMQIEPDAPQNALSSASSSKADAGAGTVARESSPPPSPSEERQYQPAEQDIQMQMPQSPAAADIEVAPQQTTAVAEEVEVSAVDTGSALETEAVAQEPIATSSPIIASNTEAIEHAASAQDSSSDPIERPSSSEAHPREKSPDEDEPIKDITSQLSNGISEVSRRPSPMNGNDSGTAAVQEAMMLDASDNALQTSSISLQSSGPETVEEEPDSSSEQQVGARSSLDASRELAASPELFDSIRSMVNRAENSSQISRSTPPRVGHRTTLEIPMLIVSQDNLTADIPEVSVQPASADREQAHLKAQPSTTLSSHTPRRSPRLAPSSPILPPTSSTTLYPDLAALQEESQISQPSFAGVSSAESISEPIQESSQVDELESQTQAAPSRFADVPSSSPIRRYDFDSASQIDALASQPPPVLSDNLNGSQPYSASQAIHAAVKRVTSVSKHGPPQSPSNSDISGAFI
jgi:hypothetical protein